MAKSVTLSAVNSSLDQTATRPWTGAAMRCASAKSPVDLVHLSRHSLVEVYIENEIKKYSEKIWYVHNGSVCSKYHF